MAEIKVPNEDIMSDIAVELNFARRKFPTNALMYHALAEEVGEVAKALLDMAHGKGSHDGVYREAVQVAAMAIRLATEGEAGSSYDPVLGYRRVGKP